MTNKLFNYILLYMAERSEAKNAKRSFASKIKIWNILTRSFASRFLLRFAQQFLIRFNQTTNRSFYPQGLNQENFWIFFARQIFDELKKGRVSLHSAGKLLCFVWQLQSGWIQRKDETDSCKFSVFKNMAWTRRFTVSYVFSKSRRESARGFSSKQCQAVCTDG